MKVIQKLMKYNILLYNDKLLNHYLIMKIYCKFKFILIIISIFCFCYFNIIDLNSNNSNNNIKIFRPKISIFLPIYNKEKYLKRSIGSIQKQTLKELEIIAINDGSTDNSLKILKNLSEKDSRIKIINNEKNRGLLYSRAVGILNSKADYLMNLDPDDEFHGSNNLKYLYNKIKRYNVDMISFIMLYLPEGKKFGNSIVSNKIINQPELYQSAFKNNILIDYFITNKIIRKELLLTAFKIFKQKIYKDKWNYHEDNIWSILVNKYANSSLNINRIIYYYYKNKDSEMENKGNELEMINLLYRYDMFKEIFKSKIEKEYFIAGYNELLYKFEENINIVIKNEKIKNKFFNISKEIKSMNISFDNIERLNVFLNKLFIKI